MKKILLTGVVLFAITSALNAQKFTGSFMWHMENIQKKNTMDMKITVGSGDKSCMEIITGTMAGKFRTIFDKKEKTMTMLVEKEGMEKMAMVRKMNDAADLAGKEPKDFKITTAEETKMIDGYNCKKVIVETNETNSEMWMTEDINLNYSETFSMINRGNGPASSAAPQMENYKDLKGSPLEMTFTNKKTGSVSHIWITDIVKEKVDESFFDTSSYKVYDMPVNPKGN